MSGATEIKGEWNGVLDTLKRIPLTTMLIGGLLVIIMTVGGFAGMSIATEITNILQRFSYWGILVLAMVPSIQSGTGPNFALPIGICAGLLALINTMELGLMGASFIIVSIVMAIPIACIFGYIYGKLMNAVKGSEMAIATYTGFAVTFLFSMIWLLYPVTNPNIGFFLGDGLRILISLDTFGAAKILETLFEFNVFGVVIPTGTLLVFFACCIIVYLFFRAKSGIAISAVGMNPVFAKATGVNVDRSRIIANMISTSLGAIGIIVYAQGFGFVQLYDAPLMMAFPAVAAVLVGGASALRSKVIHVIIGCFLFQGLLTTAPPVIGRLLQNVDADITNPIRLIVQYGVILYALTKMSGGGK